LHKQFKCYKGKVVGKLEITKQHLGHKMGEFFLTKVLGERVAYRKRQKMLLKKQKNKMKKKKIMGHLINPIAFRLGISKS